MRLIGVILLAVAPLASHCQDQLSSDQVRAALSAPPNTGFAYIEDAGFATPSECQAQMPSESIFTPVGWLSALNSNAKRTYSDFQPSAEDTGRYLTIISRGCAGGLASGPACNSVTRVVLLSDKSGARKAEAVIERPISQSWQNGFGATASCASLISKFAMVDVERIRNAKGEFLIATFSGSTPLKVFTVKEKYARKLGF